MDETFKDKKHRVNPKSNFVFIVGSCAHFQISRVHSIMSVESAIEKLQQIVRKKETHRTKHKQRWQEEAELLRRLEVEE